MRDQETISVYDQQVDTYAKLVAEEKPSAILQSFIKRLDKGSLVLDLGCGPANASVHMRAAGLQVDPVDASPQMVALANKTHDIDARVSTFDDLVVLDKYDGIWANFSLLHARRADFPTYLKRVHNALINGGWFHIGMKLGDGEKRDRLGRFYSFFQEDELHRLLETAGFEVVETTKGKDPGLAGDIEPWIIILSRKA